MILCRLIGWLLLVIALGALAFEIQQAISTGGYALIAGGELWARASANSLVGFGAVIERDVAPWFWSGIIVPILQAPGWAIPAAPGVLLALACRRRRRQHKFIGN